MSLSYMVPLDEAISPVLLDAWGEGGHGAWTLILTPSYVCLFTALILLVSWFGSRGFAARVDEGARIRAAGSRERHQ